MLRPWKLEIQLDYNSKKSLYLQIADAIILDIQSGRLKSGNALPGSRIIAEMLKVNRNTVVEALNVLINEKWIVSKERKGTFVADLIPLKSTNRVVDISFVEPIIKEKYRIIFDDGHPDSKIAPISELARAYRQIFNRNARWQMMGYSNSLGDEEFINAIVQMLNHQRGMQVNVQNICVTRGSQMAMYLTAQALLSKNDIVIIEQPGYKPAWQAFEHAGAKLIPVNVDENGVVINEIITLLESGIKVKAIYLTPHHQYPTTVTLSLNRRQKLIELSNKYGFTIIEDDYDNEFHYGYRPILPISSSQNIQKYVYIGTMSKVVAPALRIGYVATNDRNLLNKIGELRKIIDVQGDRIMEQAVLQLINDGTIKKHIRKATFHYKEKRDFVARLLDKHIKDKASYIIPEGGLAFWIVPKKEVNWELLIKKLANHKVKFIAPTNYSNNLNINGIRLGFGTLSEADLIEGIKILANSLP